MHFSKPILGTPLNFEHPLNKDLALHLACNEGHGDKVQDLSLNGNHGTLNNFAFPPTTTSGWNPGQTGIDLKYGGANDYIDCGNNPVLDITGDHTLAGLICPSTTVGVHNIFRKGFADATYALYQDGSTIKYNYYNGVDWAGSVSGGTLVVNTLACVVVTRHYSGANAKVIVYLDGVEVGSGDRVGAAGGNNSSVYIGQDAHDANFFTGVIDQPCIQSRSWTAKEVRDYAINPWQVYLDEDD